MGLPGTLLQALRPLSMVAALPTVEGLAADPEVPAGQTRVPPVLSVVVHPFQSLFGSPAEGRRFPQPKRAFGCRFGLSLDDTIVVSPMFLNEHRAHEHRRGANSLGTGGLRHGRSGAG